MDYNAVSVPSNRSRQGQYYSTVVGPYDVFAIRYGYTPVAGERSGEQHAQVAAIAAESSARAELAFSTDEDSPGSSGNDPTVSNWDLGDDPIAFHADRLALAQQLLLDAANRTVRPGESWAMQHHAVRTFMYQAYVSGVYLAKFVGGVVYSRAHRGDKNALEPNPVTPVAAAQQARALTLALQIVAGDFWMPAAEAMRKLPQHVGYGVCTDPHLDEYCLGIGSPSLLVESLTYRTHILSALLQPIRRRGLALLEWMSESGRPPAAEVRPYEAL